MVVVTGGAGILGGEIACALLGCNANVVVVDRAPARPERFLSHLKLSKGRYLAIEGDVLQKDSMDSQPKKLSLILEGSTAS